MPISQDTRSSAMVVIAVVAVGWLFLVATGVDASQSLRLVLVVGLQGLAGAIAWRAIRIGPVSAVEMVGAGLALGTAMSMLTGLIVTTLGWGTWGWVVPVIVGLVWWVVARGRQGTLMAPVDRPTLWGLLVAAVVGLGSLVPNLLSYPLAWSGIWGRYHADMLFFESLSTSLSRLGPLDSIYTPDALIRYHWLVYAWSGQVSQAASAGPFVVLTRVLPFVAVVGSTFIGIAWARRMSSAAWVPSLAVVLLVAGGYVGATYGAIFNFDSPSQSLTTLWLLAMCFAVASTLSDYPAVRRRRALVGTCSAVGLLSFALAGGKISAGAVGLAALVWVGLTGLVRRAPWRASAVWIAVSSLVAFGLGYVLVVAGSADPGGLKLANLIDRASSIQGINPVSGSTGILLGTLILTLAIAVRWAGLGWLLADRSRRWQPETTLGVGLALAGVGTVLLVSGGMNDTWFALAASAPLAVISAAGAGDAWSSLGPRRWVALAWSVVAAAALFLGVSLIWATGASGGNVWVGTLRWLGPLVGFAGALAAGWLIGRRFGLPGQRPWLAGSVIVLVLLSAPGRALGFGTGQVGVQPGLSEEAFSPIGSFTTAIDTTAIREWSDRHVAAADWLRDHAETADLIATNVTFSPFVPALTGLGTYASGILYQAPYGRPSGVQVLLDREKESWAFIDQPTEATAEPLCDAGVRWLWVDPSRTTTRDWTPFAEVAYSNDAAVILLLDSEACPA